jgi:hypothetical protein
MGTLKGLERDLDQVAARLTLAVGKIYEEIGGAVAERLVPATPVLTGFARGNWRPALNAPPTVPITFLDPTGASTVAKIKAVAKRAGPGDVLFITNLAPYIGALNAGSSPQASAGFVEAAVDKGTEEALEAIKRRELL